MRRVAELLRRRLRRSLGTQLLSQDSRRCGGLPACISTLRAAACAKPHTARPAPPHQPYPLSAERCASSQYGRGVLMHLPARRPAPHLCATEPAAGAGEPRVPGLVGHPVGGGPGVLLAQRVEAVGRLGVQPQGQVVPEHAAGHARLRGRGGRHAVSSARQQRGPALSRCAQSEGCPLLRVTGACCRGAWKKWKSGAEGRRVGEKEHFAGHVAPGARTPGTSAGAPLPCATPGCRSTMAAGAQMGKKSRCMCWCVLLRLPAEPGQPAAHNCGTPAVLAQGTGAPCIRCHGGQRRAALAGAAGSQGQEALARAACKPCYTSSAEMDSA